jgi:hypothetical protein
VIQTSAPVRTRPTTQAPNSFIWLPVAVMALSGISHLVTKKKAISDSTPAIARPLYRAGITFFMPGEALTKKQPMIEAMIDTAPSASGYSTALVRADVISSAPSTMVAISVTA